MIGIEVVEDAIEDAKANAELNGIMCYLVLHTLHCRYCLLDNPLYLNMSGINNIEFICGKAEDQLPTLVDSLPSFSEVVAIVDPPRAGLRKPIC